MGLVALIAAVGFGVLCHQAMLDFLPAFGVGPFVPESTSARVADASVP